MELLMTCNQWTKMEESLERGLVIAEEDLELLEKMLTAQIGTLNKTIGLFGKKYVEENDGPNKNEYLSRLQQQLGQARYKKLVPR